MLNKFRRFRNLWKKISRRKISKRKKDVTVSVNKKIAGNVRNVKKKSCAGSKNKTRNPRQKDNQENRNPKAKPLPQDHKNALGEKNNQKRRGEQKEREIISLLEGVIIGVNDSTLSDPKAHGMVNTTNIRIPVKHYSTLHSLRNMFASMYKSTTNVNSADEELGGWLVSPAVRKSKDGNFTVLYLQGAGGNRGADNRKEMYKFIQSAGLAVLAMDFRGYGDSTNAVPNKTNMVRDAISAVKWINKTRPTTQIIVWGHSLGTGVALKMASTLRGKNKKYPRAYILEAPFFSMIDVVKGLCDRNLCLEGSKLHKGFCMKDLSKSTIANVSKSMFKRMDMDFDNRKYVKQITNPIYILHSTSDEVIPFAQGKALYDQRVKYQLSVKLVEFDSDNELGHNSLSQYGIGLIDIINKITNDITSNASLEFEDSGGHCW